jgi:hypothetical protein
MRRKRSGKRLELTERDIAIFKLLERYRYLPSSYIHPFVGGTSEKRFKERLGDLFHEGYLDRPERQWEMASCRHRPSIHDIGSGAKRILAEQGIVEDPITWLSASAYRQFSHSLLVCECLASTELGTRQHPAVRFISWPEILAKAPAQTRVSALPFQFPAMATSPAIAPDALFGIEYATGEAMAYRFFALEADRGSMPVVRSDSSKTSFMAKAAAYREIVARKMHKSQLGIPTLLVLTVTTSEARMKEMLKQTEAQFGGNPLFLFKSVDVSDLSAPVTRLFFEPWERAGCPSLRIDEQ